MRARTPSTNCMVPWCARGPGEFTRSFICLTAGLRVLTGCIAAQMRARFSRFGGSASLIKDALESKQKLQKYAKPPTRKCSAKTWDRGMCCASLKGAPRLLCSEPQARSCFQASDANGDGQVSAAVCSWGFLVSGWLSTARLSWLQHLTFGTAVARALSQPGDVGLA